MKALLNTFLQMVSIISMNVNKTKIPATKGGSFENEALENEDRSTKHPNLENEAPKTRNHCRLNNYNFTSSMTQSESGGGSGCVRTSKGRQNPSQGFIKACKLFNWTFLDRISYIHFIISLAILDTSYFNMQFFLVHIYVYVDFKTDRILTYASMRGH